MSEKPHIEGVIDGPDARFVDSRGESHTLWAAAHLATYQTRGEFDIWARARFGEHFCEVLFGADQHGDRFDHETREWVPSKRGVTVARSWMR